MLKSFANSTSLGFMFLLLGSITQAQIVNVEAKRGVINEQEGWHGNINFNLSFQRNTSDILTYGNKSTIQWQKKKHRLLLLTDLSLSLIHI